MDIQALKPKIAEIAQKYGLDLVVLFGSQATGRTHPKSDVDIAVISTNGVDMSRLLLDVCNVFGRQDVEVVDLASASPTLMYVVVRDGTLLYEHQSGAFLKWKLYAIWVWLDSAWLRRLRDQKLIEWAKTA